MSRRRQEDFPQRFSHTGKSRSLRLLIGCRSPHRPDSQSSTSENVVANMLKIYILLPIVQHFRKAYFIKVRLGVQTTAEMFSLCPLHARTGLRYAWFEKSLCLFAWFAWKVLCLTRKTHEAKTITHFPVWRGPAVSVKIFLFFGSTIIDNFAAPTTSNWE